MRCQFTATVLAASAFFSAASAGPIMARQVCGSVPTGAVAQTPLSQPTGITTAADCAAQCKGNPACLAFLFGLIDGIDKCILYSVPASSIPPQGSLVAYDIACTSIPSVVPTTANPGGLNIGAGAASQGSAQESAQGSAEGAQRRQQGQASAPGATTGASNPATNGGTTPATSAGYGTHAAPLNSKPSGSPTPIATPVVDSLAACLAACEDNPACVNYVFESGVCDLFGPKSVAGRSPQAVGTHSAALNEIPPGNPAPIATPAVDSLAACLAACEGNPACVNYVFESGVCELFGSTAARRQTTTSAPGANDPATGTAPTGTTGTHDAPVNGIPAGNPTPIATPAVDSLAACLAACEGNPACVNYVFESGVCELFGPTAARRQTTTSAPGANDPATGTAPTGTTGTHDAPVNGIPAGNPTPIATPAVDSLAACLAACEGNPACVNYVFTSGVCKLFA